MKKIIAHLFVLSILIGIGFPLKAQVKNEEVLLTIGGKPVTVGEFMAVYLKNDQKKCLLMFYQVSISMFFRLRMLRLLSDLLQ